MKILMQIPLLFCLLFLPTLTALECCQEQDWSMTLRLAYYRPNAQIVRDAYRNGWLEYQFEVSRLICPNFEVWGGVSWSMEKGEGAPRHEHWHFSGSFSDPNFRRLDERGHPRDSEFASHFNDHSDESGSTSHSSSSHSSSSQSDFSSHHEKHRRPKLWILPLSLGVKYLFPVFTCGEISADVYVGAGICYTFVNLEHNNAPFIEHNVRRSHVGGLLKSGLKIALNDYFYLDLFLDYFVQRFHFSGSHNGVKRHDLNLDGIKTGFGFTVTF